MNIHYFQHVPFESPGYISEWLSGKGYTVACTKFYEPNYVLPELDKIDILIVMGGPMGVYDDHLYPWLPKEKAFIEDAIHASKKVLGICLGGQLIATCLGAYVNTAPHKEIGWFPVYPTGEKTTYTWLDDLFIDSPTVFHWHGDRFDIPYGAHNLASSDVNINQAFLYKDYVLALQFHLEVMEDNVQAMLTHCGQELTAAKHIQSQQEILDGKKYIQQTNELMKRILENFIGA